VTDSSRGEGDFIEPLHHFTPPSTEHGEDDDDDDDEDDILLLRRVTYWEVPAFEGSFVSEPQWS